uniref:Transposase (Putative), gypsy type n=1 Tax=Tanacetum cinerariifolium TaxID=118510 RepID=A0A6L2P6L8_TANCI|nr:hypothetical protein [Tanacetum cinerariifolium]
MKTGSRPRAPHEVPLLTLTAPRVIEMDKPAATDSSGSSHGEKSLAAIQLGLASTVVPEDAPVGVSDPDPLSFADAPSRHPVDIALRNGVLPMVACLTRHMHNEEFLRQYNVNLARHVAMGSQMRLRFEQEVTTLQQQVSGEEKLKAAFEEFKRQQDERVEQQCAEMDARPDALSIDFDEELYPHMLTAIAGRRWVISRGLHLAVMKCGESLELRQAFADAVSAGIAKGLSEGLRHGLEHGQAQRSLESIEAYDPVAEAKFVAALQALKDLKYPLVDQLEGMRDAPMDVIMAALYLESDTGDDASQEIGLADAIAANISRAEKKKRCRIVWRTHGVGSAHHARSDGVLVSAPTMVPQGLALLLADAATQTESDDT